MAELQEIPAKIEDLLARMDRVVEIAHFMADTRAVLFLGRNVGYPVALEGALKLKELAYIHAEGFAAGELKHGPIALIERRPAGVRHRAEPRHPARAAQARSSPTSRRSAPAARAPSSSPTTATTTSSPTPARSSASRMLAAAGAAAGRRAAAGLRAAPVHGQGPRRRPASQPREVGHGRRRLIVGVGIDVVDVARFGATLERTPALRERLFTTASATCR